MSDTLTDMFLKSLKPEEMEYTRREKGGFGELYHSKGRLPVTGALPRNAICNLHRQCAKFGKLTITFLPTRSISRSAFSGFFNVCTVCESIT